MEKITALLVDDEERARRVIKKLLLRSSAPIQIVDECATVEEAVQSIKTHKPQVVFLDVQMPQYEGYELVNFFTEIDFEIIFVTAYDHYAIKAFEVSAIDYLLKPIDRERLDEALKKISHKLASKDRLNKYQELLKTIESSRKSKLIIPELGNRRIIDLEEIIAIKADGAYTLIYISDGQMVTTSKNLKHYENALSSASSFFRSHRSWIINTNYLEQFNRTANLLQLKGGINARISRNQYNSFDALF